MKHAFFVVVFAPPVRNLNTLAIFTDVFAGQARTGGCECVSWLIIALLKFLNDNSVFVAI
jgi:hypothetical protein